MNELFNEWMECQKTLAMYKKKELTLRKAVLEELPGELGTESNQVDEHHEFKVTRNITRKLDAAVLDSIFDDLSELECACITYKPALDAKVYAKLDPGSMLSRAVTVTPSLPSIKVVETDGD